MNNKYTNLNWSLRNQAGCTSVRYRTRGKKEYITTVGGREEDVRWILEKITRFTDPYITSGGWPTRTFTWRVV